MRVARVDDQRGLPVVAPRETAIGALAHYVSHAEPSTYQPTNVTFGILAPLEGRHRGKDRKLAYSARALEALARWVETHRVHGGEVVRGTA